MKTIALGVDGMEPSLCERWVKEGELPHIAGLRDNGAFGTAECRTLISARQWTTHFTGVRANRHGIQGFLKQADKPIFDSRPGTRVTPDAKKLITTADIRVKTYPELLAENGISVGLVNPLPLWPPLELDGGFCISGMVTPPDAEVYTSPISLANELGEFGYRIDVRYGDRPFGFIDDSLFADNEVGIEELREDMFDVLDSRIEYVKYCLDEKNVGFFYGLLKAIDIIQHTFWAHMEDGDAQYGDTILESYRRVDSLIGWIQEACTNANLLVFSDHGFGPRHSPRSKLLQSAVYGIDNMITVPPKLRQLYRSVLKRDAKPDIQHLDQISGDHANPAIWMLGGPGVNTQNELSIHFEDLTPTLLALHGCPVPNDYTGRVIDQAIVSKPTYTEEDLEANRREGADSVVSERLYNLGYAEMVDSAHGDE